jgi:uncharacterized protein YecA (UPF0149 family)
MHRPPSACADVVNHIARSRSHSGFAALELPRAAKALPRRADVRQFFNAPKPKERHMGAMAEAFASFAQPLLDQTDGSLEEMNKALTLAQFCYNLALSPEESREETLNELRSALGMDEEEFAEIRRSTLDPMVRRHEQMFPRMNEIFSTGHNRSFRSEPDIPKIASEKTVIDRYGPCPCNSGRKYKFCCGKKGR